MTLSDRIQQALNDFHSDNADIDVMVGLLVESQATINQADTNFKSIMALSDSIDKACEDIKASLYQGNQA